MAANQSQVLEQAQMLATRLERLSADSGWAHRASGVRGSLLKAIEAVERAEAAGERVELEKNEALARLVGIGFTMLERAAIELIE